MKKVYAFLKDLGNNNSKQWMDDNRKYYHEAKQIWIDQLDAIYTRLANHDSRFDTVVPKKTIMRINNNRMFHPDRPVYKDNFGASPFGKDSPELYLHISPNGNMIGGGMYRPDNDGLKKIREAIDYDGQELLDIINKKSFIKYYGGLTYDHTKLKTSPRGYPIDHEYIDLLRRKSFAAFVSKCKNFFRY